MDSGVPYYFQTNPKGHHQTSHACVLKSTATIFVTAVTGPRASDTRTHVLKEKTSDGMSTPTRSLPNHSIHFFWISRSFEVNQSWDPTQEVSFSHQNPSKNLRSYPHGITLHSFRSRRLLDSSKKPLRCSDVPVLMGNCRKQKRFPSQLPSSGRAINIHLAGLRMKTWDVDTVKTPKIRPFNGESEVLNPTRS